MKPTDDPKAGCSRLLEEIRRAAGDLDRPYALLDFPDHGNVGDSAIWLGERRALERLFGAPPVYTGGVGCFAEQNLRCRLGERGIVFLHGGGNFGDLWERHQLFRERVVQALPDLSIVMLAQTVHFEEEGSLDRARRVLDGHRSLTMLVRDEESLELVRRSFDRPVRLSPDGALGLPSMRRSTAPDVDLLLLLRRDRERKVSVPRPGGSTTAEVVDWLEPPATLVERLDRRIRWLRNQGRRPDRVLVGPSGKLGDAAARARLQRGVDTLSTGRVVITDRLHGHVLSTMLGIPNVLLDNSYGKNRRYYETWSRTDPLSRFCVEPAEALEVAFDLAGVQGRAAGADAH